MFIVRIGSNLLSGGTLASKSELSVYACVLTRVTDANVIIIVTASKSGVKCFILSSFTYKTHSRSGAVPQNTPAS